MDPQEFPLYNHPKNPSVLWDSIILLLTCLYDSIPCLTRALQRHVWAESSTSICIVILSFCEPLKFQAMSFVELKEQSPIRDNGHWALLPEMLVSFCHAWTTSQTSQGSLSRGTTTSCSVIIAVELMFAGHDAHDSNASSNGSWNKDLAETWELKHIKLSLMVNSGRKKNSSQAVKNKKFIE